MAIASRDRRGAHGGMGHGAVCRSFGCVLLLLLCLGTAHAEEKRLRAGPGNTFFVAQQQELLAFAEVQEANAHADYYKALAEYDRQLGVTLAKRSIAIDPPK